MKQNSYITYLKGLSYRSLKKELSNLNYAINKFGCFSGNDIALREYIVKLVEAKQKEMREK